MKNKADMQDRGRDATGEVFIAQVSDSHSKLAQAPPPWWHFGGKEQQPACLFSWCSTGNPWLSQQATTGQGVLRGIALCHSQQECLKSVRKWDRGLPTENCETGSGCRRMSTSRNKARSEDRPSVGGQGREAIASSGAYQETTVPKDCWLCYVSIDPSPDTGFCLS